MQASKGRHDLLLHKIRLERVTGVLKNERSVLYEVEQKMISDGHLDPIMLTPQKKTEHLMLKDGKDDEDKHDPHASDSEAENDDNKEFGRNMNEWSDLPTAVWKRIFKRWNSKIFTKASINAMVLRGQCETSLKSVHLLAEAMTDITMDETIDISKHTKRKFTDHQVQRCIAGGD